MIEKLVFLESGGVSIIIGTLQRSGMGEERCGQYHLLDGGGLKKPNGRWSPQRVLVRVWGDY